MKTRTEEKKLLQWHPAFYAGIQIELKDDATNLIFENEHQLGTKPMGIDVLIIKKKEGLPIHDGCNCKSKPENISGGKNYV